ncbi:MAG: DUF1841 family protein [Betaproteobacteria bacterium]|jgi:hypothetical protein|nr:DUF1841 family protein [Betaproteobacteria bacterium]
MTGGSTLFNPTREQVRDFFFETWRKFSSQAPLTALQAMAVEIINEHPEYHALLSQRDRHVDRDYLPESGDLNPFLHMSMHLSIREQVSIDQPAGVRAEHQRLAISMGDVKAAEHAMMDCLGEMIWHAQRNRTAPDPGLYLACLARK